MLAKKKASQIVPEKSDSEPNYTYNSFYTSGNKHFDQTFNKNDSTTQSMVFYNPDGTKLCEQTFEHGAISSVINHLETGLTFV